MISRQSRVWTSSFWRNYTKCMGKNLALVDHLGPLKCLISYDLVIYWWRPKKKKKPFPKLPLLSVWRVHPGRVWAEDAVSDPCSAGAVLRGSTHWRWLWVPEPGAGQRLSLSSCWRGQGQSNGAKGNDFLVSASAALYSVKSSFLNCKTTNFGNQNPEKEARNTSFLGIEVLLLWKTF